MPKGKGIKAERRTKEMRKRTLRNRGSRSAVKTYIAAAGDAILTDVDSSDAAIIKAQKALDTAVSHGILHRNNAARRLSRLMKKFNNKVIAG